MTDSTDTLIRDLANALSPVRPIVRLRWSIGWTAVSAVAIGAVWRLVTRAAGIPRPMSSTFDFLHLPPVYLMVAAILVLSACGGLIAGLSEGIPGRETLARRGRWVALGSGVVTFVVLIVTVARFGIPPPDPSPIAFSWLQCGVAAALLAIPPLFVCMRTLLRGTTAHPGRAIYLGCVGAMGLSAAAVHTTCPNLVAFHQLLGHGLAPILAGAVLWTGIRFKPGANSMDGLREHRP